MGWNHQPDDDDDDDDDDDAGIPKTSLSNFHVSTAWNSHDPYPFLEGPGGSGENAAKPIPDPASWEATGEARRSEDLRIYGETGSWNWF